jgi:hypothetical protein
MPVVAAVKSWRQFLRWGRVGIAIQRVANVIWILFMDARECKIGKPFSRFDVEVTCILGGSSSWRAGTWHRRSISSANTLTE